MCAAKWVLGGARVVSKEGSRPGRRAFPYVLGCARVVLWYQRSSESRKNQILLVVMDRHVSTTTRTNPFAHPPHTTQVERLRAPYCGVEPELAGSLWVKVVTGKLIHYTPAGDTAQD